MEIRMCDIRCYINIAGLLAVGGLASCATAPMGERVALLLHNGRVFTAEDTIRGPHTAVAILGNRIVAVGGDELLRAYVAEHAIDLGGRLVLPGFNDTHIHVRGFPPWHVDLSSLTSIDEIKNAIRLKAAELGHGHWITGSGWAEGILSDGRAPHRRDLDDAARHHPVVLARAGGHSAVANSLALDIAGIGRDTPQPDGGVIEQDPDGEPNGIIREREDLIYRHVPRAEREDLRPDLVRNLRSLLALGITSIIEAGKPPDEYLEWEAVYAEHHGDLPRAAVQIYPGLAAGRASAGEAIARLQRFGRRTGEGDAWLRVAGVKLWVDGGFAGPAAWTLEPYPNQPGYFGIQNVEEEDLYRLLRAAHDDGWQAGIHAIGDAAIKLTVDVLERIITENPRSDHRHYLNHFTVMPPDETMRKMARHGIWIAQQPNFTWSPTLESRYRENLAGARLAHNNPLRTPMNYGIFVALGADNHPTGPMPGIYAAVTRRGASGHYYGVEERLSIAEAVVAYTRNGAYLTFEESEKGTLSAGKLADLVVLSDNLFEIDVDRILDIEVDLTLLDGRIVYERVGGLLTTSR
jgi:predicted amidohydrolase YtcJ